MKFQMIRSLPALLAAFLAYALPAASAQAQAIVSHGIAMHGEPALPPDFRNFPYVNPDAPKGGTAAIGFYGAFNSLNPYNLNAGSAAQGLSGNVFQGLMTRSLDEPFTLYRLVAESIETDAARSYVLFRLDPRARFSDGTPLTSADVLFSFELLKAKGRPQQRSAYKLVQKAEAPDAHTVRYDLTGVNDRELPLILAIMPILPKHKTDAEAFDNTTLTIPVGSGPYVISAVKPGEQVKMTRNPDYWGKDLPVMRGLFNFGEIRFDYFRDTNTWYEAMASGVIDFRPESDPTRWTQAYNFPALADGRVIRETISFGLPKGMDGIAFNTRRPLFKDVRVREALAMVFDFEWINTNIYAGVYKRSRSFYDDSELSSAGRPADSRERGLLAAWPDAVRPDILEGTWTPPVTDGSGRDRAPARRALALLAEAGYVLRETVLVEKATGTPVTIEIPAEDRGQERLLLNYAEQLRRIGVAVRIRLLDEALFQRRRQTYDFDMMVGTWAASPSPGNEQRGRWGSASAIIEGSFNLAGAQSPAIDGMIKAILAAQSHEDFTAAVRAYDRVLLSGFYIVPLFYTPGQWIAYSSRIMHPARFPLFGVNIDCWWSAAP